MHNAECIIWKKSEISVEISDFFDIITSLGKWCYYGIYYYCRRFGGAFWT